MSTDEQVVLVCSAWRRFSPALRAYILEIEGLPPDTEVVDYAPGKVPWRLPAKPSKPTTPAPVPETQTFLPEKQTEPRRPLPRPSAAYAIDAMNRPLKRRP